MTARQVHKVRGMLRNPTTTYGTICHVAGISGMQLFSILAALPTAESINLHFRARVRKAMEARQ